MSELERKATFDMGTGDQVVIDLHTIEVRIAGYMQGIAFNLLQVGRCLMIARDAQLVPHGQWEEWVRANTGLSERRAQRLMQAAKIAPEGSSIAALPVSKIMALLPLPEDKREEVAAQAIEDNLTVRQLQEQVDVLRSEGEKQQKIHESRVARLKDEVNKYVNAVFRVDHEKHELMNRCAMLETKIEELLDSAAPTGISPEAQAEIDRLKAEIADAEAYAEKQAELRQQAQRELMNQRIQSDHDDHAYSPTVDPDAVQIAVNTFIGVLGVMPYMDSVQIARMPVADRQRIMQYIAMIDAWVTGVRGKFDDDQVVEIEGAD